MAEITSETEAGPRQERMKRLLAYVALGLLGLMAVAVVSFYTARISAAKVYKQGDGRIVLKAPAPEQELNFGREFRGNTADKSPRRFVRFRMSLGLNKGDARLAAEIAGRNAKIRHVIHLLLAGKTAAEIESRQGRIELAEEIKAAVNHMLTHGRVRGVYFSDFLVH